jgi:hypothetical protein
MSKPATNLESVQGSVANSSVSRNSMQPASANAINETSGRGAASAASNNGVPGSSNGTCTVVNATGLPMTGPCYLFSGNGTSSPQYTVNSAASATPSSPAVALWMDVLQTVFVGPSAEAGATDQFGGTGCPISGCTQPRPSLATAPPPTQTSKQSNVEPITARPAPGLPPTSPSPIEHDPVDEAKIDMVLNDPHACPDASIPPWDSKPICNPNDQKSKACNQMEPGSAAQNDCNARTSACYTAQTALKNEVRAYNERYNQCHRKADESTDD